MGKVAIGNAPQTRSCPAHGNAAVYQIRTAVQIGIADMLINATKDGADLELTSHMVVENNMLKELHQNSQGSCDVTYHGRIPAVNNKKKNFSCFDIHIYANL